MISRNATRLGKGSGISPRACKTAEALEEHADEAVSVFDFGTRTSRLKARESLYLPCENDFVSRK